MSPIDLAGARARLAAATPGPWRRYGNVKHRVCYLATIDRGRIFVLDFERWGFGQAQPRFQVRNRMVPLGKMEAEGEAYSPIWEVAPFGQPRYRDDFQGIAHPDAAFIEHSWADLRDALAEVDRLAAERLAFERALVDIVNDTEADGEDARDRARKALAARPDFEAAIAQLETRRKAAEVTS